MAHPGKLTQEEGQLRVAEPNIEGRVVLVTGAGRGLGRAYALALAERGARVIVNDLGSAMDGSGSASEVAEAVVSEIRAAGGTAVADGNDVTRAEGGKAMIAAATQAFGRIDAVVNNAGICRDSPFMETSDADFERNWRIHVMGHINVTRAAWPEFVRQGGGRVVMTGSGAGLFGLANETAYAAAKGAIHGLSRSLAIEGAPLGIRVNTILPGGVSRMHEEAFPDPATLDMMRTLMPADLVAPAVVWMVSDACRETGQSYSVWGGRIARLVVGTGRGLVDRALTAEAITTQSGARNSADGLYEPADGIDDVAHWQPVLLE
jgi:NAD(P)-dependent dehydrogenase (short-subunit alcohol dehydrogenase family)